MEAGNGELISLQLPAYRPANLAVLSNVYSFTTFTVPASAS
jgi:hypothetical protein